LFPDLSLKLLSNLIQGLFKNKAKKKKFLIVLFVSDFICLAFVSRTFKLVKIEKAARPKKDQRPKKLQTISNKVCKVACFS